jgi:hypothetical protein
MTISATLDRAVRLYRANFVPMLSIALVGVVLAIPVALIDNKNGALTTRHLGPLPFGVVYALDILVVTPWLYAALTAGALAILAGQRPSAGAAFAMATRRLGPACAVNFLTLLAGLFTLPLLIVPGAYVLLGFSFSIVALMEAARRDQNLGAIEAMRKSWALVMGRRGQLLGVLLVWALLQLVLSFALGGLLGLVGIDGAPREVVKQLTSVLIMPCMGLSLGLLFNEARVQREGLDLAAEAARLGGELPAPGVPAV